MTFEPDNTRFSDEFEVLEDLTFFQKIWLCVLIMLSAWRILKDRGVSEKLRRLAALRRERPHVTAMHLQKLAFSMIPKNLDALDGPTGEDIVVRVLPEHEQSYEIATNDGMIFHDHIGSRKHRQLYWLLRDKSQSIYDSETFFARSAVYRSYVHGVGRVPGDRFAAVPGGVIIEAGAYVGYKALAFAKVVGKGGFVGAIEANPRNYTLLKRNIENNQVSARVEATHCAVWNKTDTLMLTGKGRMQNTVARTDELEFAETAKIPARTLDDILDSFGVDHVNFLNLQLNGAEIEAIEGLQRRFKDVEYINIITRYKRDGEYVVDVAKRMLLDRQCEIVVDYRSERLFNLTARVVT